MVVGIALGLAVAFLLLGLGLHCFLRARRRARSEEKVQPAILRKVISSARASACIPEPENESKCTTDTSGTTPKDACFAPSGVTAAVSLPEQGPISAVLSSRRGPPVSSCRSPCLGSSPSSCVAHADADFRNKASRAKLMPPVPV